MTDWIKLLDDMEAYVVGGEQYEIAAKILNLKKIISKSKSKAKK
jgi:hypothetical protein